MDSASAEIRVGDTLRTVNLRVTPPIVYSVDIELDRVTVTEPNGTRWSCTVTNFLALVS